MKYIITILISFALIHPVYAVKMVKGSVPVVQPLQPPAAGISSNVSHNIQSQSGLSNEAIGQAPQATPTASAQSGQAQTPDQAQAPAPAATYKKSSTWIWWLFILAALGGLGFWLKRKGSQA